MTPTTIEKRCVELGMKMTGQRRVIARVLDTSDDHPSVDDVFERAQAIDPKISIATVYRTMRLFEEAGIVERLDFGDGRARYEAKSDQHHDHLINVRTGEVVEFKSEALERLKEEVAARYGFRLIGHRLKLYGVPDENIKNGNL